MHRYRAIDEKYFEVAPVRLEERVLLEAPARHALWLLEDNRVWEAFQFSIERATWTSPTPPRTGATRRLEMTRFLNNGVVDETFFVWDPQSHFAFYMSQGTWKSLEAFGEFWHVRDLEDGRSELHLRVGFEFKSRFANRILAALTPLLRIGFRSTLAEFARFVHANPPTDRTDEP